MLQNLSEAVENLKWAMGEFEGLLAAAESAPPLVCAHAMVTLSQLADRLERLSGKFGGAVTWKTPAAQAAKK